MLSEIYEKSSAANKVHLMQRLFNLQMGDDTDVGDHLDEFNVVISKLSYIDINFDDEIQAIILLSSLPDSWSTTVTVFSASTCKLKLK